MRSSTLMKTVSSLAVALAAVAPAAFADVKPARIFNENMVLQRDAEVPVWGWAEPGEQVEVSFAGQTQSTTANAKGEWEVRLAPLALNKAGGTMTIRGKNTVELKNILVGDVWLCSGQSNMEMSFDWGIMGGPEFIAESENYPQIRRIKIARETSAEPVADVDASGWSVCSPDTVRPFTAAGYFFARKLTQELDSLPIGILDDNWSGSRIEPFIPPEGFELLPEFAERAGSDCSRDDSIRYNAMMAPIVRFPIKGVIWYQGCSNGSDGILYFKYMKALIEGWRKVWNEPDMPFYYVQLAAFDAATAAPAGGDGYAEIREVQTLSLSIPNTGMACTIDIGDSLDIHPKNKIDVGERLALWALAKTYGQQEVVFSGPLYKSMKIEGNRIRLSFDYADGLMTAVKTGYEKPVPAPGEKPSNFAVCDGNGEWFWADAVIEGEEVLVSSPDVAEPTAVRYAYRGCPVNLNMYNKAGLPMVPFRTDMPQEIK